MTKEVLAGKWGDGGDRKKRLQDMIMGQRRESDRKTERSSRDMEQSEYK